MNIWVDWTHWRCLAKVKVAGLEKVLEYFILSNYYCVVKYD